MCLCSKEDSSVKLGRCAGSNLILCLTLIFGRNLSLYAQIEDGISFNIDY